jgi:hypothetical protein
MMKDVRDEEDKDWGEQGERVQTSGRFTGGLL